MGRAAPAPPARGSTLLVTVQEKRKAKLSSDTPHPAGGLSGAPKAVRCSERARQKPGEAGVTRKAPRPSLCATGKETPLCAEGCSWQRNCRQGLDETGTDSKGVPYSASSLMQDTSLLGYPSPRNPPHWPYPRDTLNQELTHWAGHGPMTVSMATCHAGGAGPANGGIWKSLGTWQCPGGWREEELAPQEAEKHLEGESGPGS